MGFWFVASFHGESWVVIQLLNYVTLAIVRRILTSVVKSIENREKKGKIYGAMIFDKIYIFFILPRDKNV